MTKNPKSSPPLTPEELIVKRQYFVTQDYKDKEVGKLKENSITLLKPNEVTPLISAGIIIPLQVALRQGLYPVDPEPTIVEKLKEATKKKATRTKKQYLGNKLRDTVQAKKAERSNPTQAELDQIAKIKSLKNKK